MREKFLSKPDRFDPKPAPRHTSKYRDTEPILPKGFTDELIEKATSPQQNGSIIRRNVVDEDDLPILGKGYKITPSIAKLKQRT